MTVSSVSVAEAGDEIHRRARYDVKFASGCALLGLLSNIRSVDRLVGGLRHDSIALITGSRVRLRAIESYCLRAQLSEDHGGFDGASFFIDGGNSFDIYLFTSIARAHGFDYRDAMDKLIISRAFTPYELKQLVCKDSAEVFRTRRPRLLVVSEVFSLFEHDIEAGEATRVMNKVFGSIVLTSRLQRIPIVVTAASVPEYLEKFADHTCNIRADFIEEDHRIVGRLLKHPSRSPTQVVEEVSGCYNQSLISPLMVTAHG